MNWSNKLECFFQVILSSFVTVEQSSLLDKYISYEENEESVVNTVPETTFTTLYFSITYGLDK